MGMPTLVPRYRQLTRTRFLGPPSLVIEVVSHSSKRTDRLQKRDLYIEDGVDEYWVLDPDQRRLERWRPGAAGPELLSDRMAWSPVPAVPPFELDLAELFRKIWR
jgi:Uma2 family endonuclease